MAPEPSGEVIEELVELFKLLSDRIRLRILMLLFRNGEMHVRALCEHLGQSQPAVSHHLALLRRTRLIEPRREGKHNFYSIRRRRFQELLGVLFDTMPEAARGDILAENYRHAQDAAGPQAADEATSEPEG